MMNSDAGRCPPEPSSGCLRLEDVEEEFREWAQRAHPQQCVLEAAVVDLVGPERGLADLAGAPRCLGEDNVPLSEPINLDFFRGEVHLLHVAEIEAGPRDVRRPEIRPHVWADVVLWRSLTAQ